MADETLLKKVHNLSDLELAVLLCLISREHCLISTFPEALDDLVDELQLISAKIFGLKPVIIDCTPHTTLNDFATSLLLPHFQQQQQQQQQQRRDASPSSYFLSQPAVRPPSSTTLGSPSSAPPPGPHSSRIANVILARNLDRAPPAVQIQALELLRTRRIFTRTSVQAAPRQFLFVGVLASGGVGGRPEAEAGVTPHLNDMFYVAHWHDPEDGFPNLEEQEQEVEGSGRLGGLVEDSASSDTASTTSVVRKSWYEPEGEGPSGPEEAIFSEGDIACLAKLSQEVQLDVDVQRYQLNVVSFLRMHRAVAGGITPMATRHFEQLMRCLAPLHGLDFVTPSLVALAARKVYLHRIRVVAPAKERSMQWGSDLAAVEALLRDVGPEDVIEDVLGMVAAPV